MLKIDVYNQKGEKVGDLKLSDKVFGIKVNEALVHQAVVTQMANERQVLAHTKGRAEVRGGGTKPWRQKGTGRARVGSIRSPIWKGGGVTFGPTSARNFSKKINKKMKQKALLMTLSDKVKNKNFVIIDKLEMNEFKTKMFNEMLETLIDAKSTQSKTKTKDAKETKETKKTPKKQKKSVLVVNDQKNDKIKYSAKNLVGVKLINLNNINIVDLLKYKNFVITAEAAKEIEKKYA